MMVCGIMKEGIYFVKKRVIMMLCKIVFNFLGLVVGVSKAESEEIVYRFLFVLARITEKGCVYFVFMCGGFCMVVECLCYYLYNFDMMYVCMCVLCVLFMDLSMMMRLMK